MTGRGPGFRAARVSLPALISALFVCTTGAQAVIVRVDPNSMRVQSVFHNTHLATLTPRFQWTFPGTGTQTNWQIQVDSSPQFNGHNGEIWFWDSGVADKGTLDSDTDVAYSTPNAPGKFPRSLDTRADLIYWRVRVQQDNDANWDKDPNDFAVGVFKLNQIPLSPDNLTATVDPNAGTIAGFTFPAVVTTPRELFVATNGDDANPGTLALPFRTITFGAKALLPGDTLTIRGGTYNENVRLSPTPTTGVKNGTAGNPITIRGRPGESVIVRGVSAGSSPFAPFSFIGSPVAITNWILDGVKLGGGTAVSHGIFVNFAEHLTIRNISFESTFNPSGTGIQILGSGSGNRILNSKLDTRMFDQIDITGSKHVEIRNNEFTGGNGHVAIHWHNSGGQAGIIEGNRFHDFTATEGAIFVYLSGDGMVVRNNVFLNVSETAGGYNAGIVVLRCGKILIENNTFVNITRGVGLAEFARFSIVRNNIFFNTTKTAIDFTLLQSAQQGSSTVGFVVDHNLFFDNTKDTDYSASTKTADLADITYTNNCCFASVGNQCDGTRTAPNVNAACDPQFVNAAAGDLHLGAASPARDAGDPNTPVPVGGGSVIDMGALEFGSAAMPPYDYQPKVSVSDVTPKFTWKFVDRDNDLNARFPTDFLDTDLHFGFELQIDTRNTFDSVNGDRPLFSTSAANGFNFVASNDPNAPNYILPDANALPAGEYYVRVRNRDENQALLGAWSNNNFRIRVAAEPQAPILTQQSPAPMSVGVDPNAVVSAHVVDFGSGVASSTIVMRIFDSDPNTPDLVAPQITQVGPTSTDFRVSFTPAPGRFKSGDVITAQIEADDLFSPPNHLGGTNSMWSFTIRDSVPPLAPAGLIVVP